MGPLLSTLALVKYPAPLTPGSVSESSRQNPHPLHAPSYEGADVTVTCCSLVQRQDPWSVARESERSQQRALACRRDSQVATRPPAPCTHPRTGPPQPWWGCGTGPVAALPRAACPGLRGRTFGFTILPMSSVPPALLGKVDAPRKPTSPDRWIGPLHVGARCSSSARLLPAAGPTTRHARLGWAAIAESHQQRPRRGTGSAPRRPLHAHHQHQKAYN